MARFLAVASILLTLDRMPGHAVPAPHDSSCLQCHVTHNKLGNHTDELVCLTCHNPSGGARAQETPFSPGDAAHPFSGTGGMQSSHAWSGADTRPEAGAEPPLIPELALKQHEGKMSCAKCHNLHGPRESATNSPPFLRTLNDADQMCLDCHRSRKGGTSAGGSHPVQVRYSSAARRKAPAFYATPRSANPANATAAMKLVKGQVVCSTCHGTHYTDSSSATYDNRTSALLGLLAPSAGHLLRTEAKGAQADAVNICTTCHKGKSAHNGGGQNVQCTDCHGAHVAPIDGSAPNVWLVRRYMGYSTPSGRVSKGVKTFFLSTSARNYRDAGGTGVCQACHALPSTVADHSQPDANCSACHYHANPSGSFTASGGSCTSCHGAPPVANRAGGPDGYASGYLGVNEATSAHGSHGGEGAPYGCSDCHRGNAHATRKYQQVFLDSAGTLAARFGATPTYDTVSRSCWGTYCHSNGAPAGGALRYAPPVPFGEGKGTLVGRPYECVSCHGGAYGGFNNLSTNVHLRHVSVDSGSGRGYGCALCHAATAAANDAVADRAKHVNGVKDLSFSGVATGTSFTGGSCSTSYCHSDGKGRYATVSWSDRGSGACGTCHAATLGSGAVVASAAHFVHFSSGSFYGPMLSGSAESCQACHRYGGELDSAHVNGAVDFKATLGYLSAGTCAPCHNQGVNWKGGAVSCESCHTASLSVINGSTAPDKSLSVSRGHGAASQGCLSCHDRSARHLKGGSRLRGGLTGELNAECNHCHNDPATVAAPALRNMSTHMSVKGGGQTMPCAGCHDPHGTGNLSQIRTEIMGERIVYTDRSTGLVDPVTNRGLCQVCHSATAYYRGGVAEGTHPASDCLGCHSHRAAGGAFKPNGGCDACHGYPPAPRQTLTALTFGTQGNWSAARLENYSGGGGAHLVAQHIAPSARPSEGWDNCLPCHNGGAAAHRMALPVKTHLENVTVLVDPRYRFSSGVLPVYTGARLESGANRTGNCFNVSCHMSQSLRWSIEK